ncbi:MAG TPA: CoA transferase [Pirellulales bacterium]|jgi:crotonobetainyl-CoA:carnitine CoA-transferase CaiB-like acyl-CoA transferase
MIQAIDRQMTDRENPLAGLKVLDLSRVLAGPVCTQLLADLGADVVKVERPGLGDDTRHWGPPFLPGDGLSAYFVSANRGKRSLALDLAHPAAAETLSGLIRRADVLIENFLPDAAERFGLSPQRLAELNPRLVSCSISGYGRTGPLAALPGYDLMTQAGAGLMSITGEPDGEPMKVGVALSDVITGLYAAISVLAGLQARGTSGAGRAFDLALSDCTLASLVNIAQTTLVTGERPRRWGNAHPQIVPYESLATADGLMMLGVGNDAQWRRFCTAAGREDWNADPRFQTNRQRVAHRDELLPALRALIRERTTRHWGELLDSIDVPHGPVLAVDEVLAAPQTAARQMVLPVKDRQGREYRVLGSPIHWHGEPPRRTSAPPNLGEHSDEILREWLNYDAQKIAELRS